MYAFLTFLTSKKPRVWEIEGSGRAFENVSHWQCKTSEFWWIHECRIWLSYCFGIKVLSCLSAVQPGCCEHTYVLNEKCCPSGIMGRISVIERRRIKTHLFKSNLTWIIFKNWVCFQNFIIKMTFKRHSRQGFKTSQVNWVNDSECWKTEKVNFSIVFKD